MSHEPDDPILDEIERKMAIGEIRDAMETREFWELTEHAVAYARFVFNNARQRKFNRRQSMALAICYSKELFFHAGKSP